MYAKQQFLTSEGMIAQGSIVVDNKKAARVSHTSHQFQNRTNVDCVVLSILHNFDSLHDSWAAEMRLENTPCRDNLRIVWGHRNGQSEDTQQEKYRDC